jgi:predicted transcriptional regulator
MRAAPLVLAPDMNVFTAIDCVSSDQVKGMSLDAWPVAEGREFLGMIRDSELRRAASNGAAEKTIAEIASLQLTHRHADPPQFPHLHSDQTLSLALERMGTAKLHVLPVVSRANVRHLLGIAALPDVLEAYGVGRPSAAEEYSE